MVRRRSCAAARSGISVDDGGMPMAPAAAVLSLFQGRCKPDMRCDERPRGAAVDVWTLYAAAIATGFGIAIMQPGMPTLVREWLPNRVGLATVVYSNGMVVGAILPPVLTIPFVLPLVGGSWRLNFFVWA